MQWLIAGGAVVLLAILTGRGKDLAEFLKGGGGGGGGGGLDALGFPPVQPLTSAPTLLAGLSPSYAGPTFLASSFSPDGAVASPTYAGASGGPSFGGPDVGFTQGNVTTSPGISDAGLLSVGAFALQAALHPSAPAPSYGGPSTGFVQGSYVAPAPAPAPAAAPAPAPNPIIGFTA